MKTLRTFLVLVTALAFSASIAGCGKKDKSPKDTPAKVVDETKAPKPDEAAEPAVPAKGDPQ